MNKTRIDAIERVAAIKVPATEKIGFDINEFGTDVFGIECMRERLPKPVFKTLYKTLTEGSPLDPSIADDVANAMKRWALDKGATHYTHWFQTNTSAKSQKQNDFHQPEQNLKDINA